MTVLRMFHSRPDKSGLTTSQWADLVATMRRIYASEDMQIAKKINELISVSGGEPDLITIEITEVGDDGQ